MPRRRAGNVLWLSLRYSARDALKPVLRALAYVALALYLALGTVAVVIFAAPFLLILLALLAIAELYMRLAPNRELEGFEQAPASPLSSTFLPSRPVRFTLSARYHDAHPARYALEGISRRGALPCFCSVFISIINTEQKVLVLDMHVYRVS